MKKSKPLDDWPRLAGAAADCRDELRFLVIRLDRVLAVTDHDPLLAEIRELAARNAEKLKTALKRPSARSGQPS